MANETQPTSSAMPSPVTLRTYIIALGVPPLVFALGVGMTGFYSFWGGIVASSAAIVWFIIDWWWLSRTVVWHVRVLGFAAGLIATIFVGWVAFRPAPLNVNFYSEIGDYLENSDITGIKWQPNFSAGDIYISNPSDRTYKEIRIDVKTDLFIAQVGVATAFGQCKAVPENLYGIRGSEMQIERAGEKITLPGELVASLYYAIFCDTILAGNEIKLTLALVNARPPAQNESLLPNATLFGPRVAPKYFFVKIGYEAGGKEITKIQEYCHESTDECAALSKVHANSIGIYKVSIPK